MRLRIYRGTREIGGTCIEVENCGYRLVLDLGLPLGRNDIIGAALPGVLSFATPHPSLLGIVLSHGHRDHWGLVPRLGSTVPVIMGRATESVMVSRIRVFVDEEAAWR